MNCFLSPTPTPHVIKTKKSPVFQKMSRLCALNPQKKRGASNHSITKTTQLSLKFLWLSIIWIKLTTGQKKYNIRRLQHNNQHTGHIQEMQATGQDLHVFLPKVSFPAAILPFCNAITNVRLSPALFPHQYYFSSILYSQILNCILQFPIPSWNPRFEHINNCRVFPIILL